MRAHEFLKKRLQASSYGNDTDIKAMMNSFERQTKPTFKESSQRSYVKFGSMRDKDPSVEIRCGQLALEAHEVTKFFQPCLDEILQAIRSQQVSASAPVGIAFLVGGFAASPWLYERLRTSLQTAGMDLSRPDNHTNKAVSEGAVWFFLASSVSSRISRFTYGSPVAVVFNDGDNDHHDRVQRTTLWPSGRFMVNGGFQVILSKDEKVRNEDERRKPFFVEESYLELLDSISADIVVYSGNLKDPRWMDKDPKSFSTLCTIHADTSRVTKKECKGPQGIYYTQKYDIVLSCGLTELKARISWKDNKGQEKWGPAKIIYDEEAKVA